MTADVPVRLEDAAAMAVMHIGAGRYRPGQADHPTFEIWRNLAKGFRKYTVLGRSMTGRSHLHHEHNLDVHLIASWVRSEAEFLFTQVKAVTLSRSSLPNVVVAQCPALGGLAASYVNARRRTPTLIELHGSHYFTKAVPGSKDWIIQALAAKSLRNATRIRALSEGMKRKLAERFGAELSSRTVVIPPRVDLNKFRYTRSDWRIDGRPKVILVGSVTQRKGQSRFLRAVFDQGLDLEVWLVGDGPQLAECRRIADKYARSHDVKVFGQVSHDELARLLPQADVLVLYSNMEGTPRAIMEGMAAGLPIVTTNAGFVSDIVNSGEEGVVLSENADQEVATALRTLFEDESLREKMGRAGRARAEKEFSADLVFDRYRKLIIETAVA